MRLFLVCISALLLSGSAFSKDLATFGKNKITDKDFKDAVERLGPQASMIKSNPQMKQRFLDHLINRTLLASKAKADKIDESKRYKDVVKELEMEALSNLYFEKYIEDNC